MATKTEMAVQFLHDLGSASPGLVEHLTDGAEYSVNAQTMKIGPFIGKKAISEKFLPTLKQIFPKGLAMTVRNVVVGDNLVAVECSSKADLSNGKVYANRYVFMFDFEGNRISNIREYADTAYAVEAMKP